MYVHTYNIIHIKYTQNPYVRMYIKMFIIQTAL